MKINRKKKNPKSNYMPYKRDCMCNCNMGQMILKKGNGIMNNSEINSKNKKTSKPE